MQLPSTLLENAVNQFSKLPGIGKKTALRLVLHLLKQDTGDVQFFSDTISKMRKEIQFCQRCHNISDGDICSICSNSLRKQKQFPSFKKYQQQIEQGFQFIHYYFPQYPLPKNIITFIGPLDGTANALTSSGMAVGLHAYLGKDFEGYHTEYISQVYPAYKSKKFEPEYVAVNCVKNIIEDMYPDKSVGRPLIERMVEAGKRMYALDACMPYTDDTLKTGYTAKQLQACMDNEKNIWAFFADNNLLYESEPSLISIYVTEGPSTPELSNEAPGFIGLFTGWQIVKKWMAKNDKKTLTDLFKTPAQQIFNEAKYKP